MAISRRAFLSRSTEIATALAAERAFGISRLRPWLLGAQQVGTPGLPKIVVEDFSKEFDPAYLSNGLIGFRPRPNPLLNASTYVGGFVTKDEDYRMESLAVAPYPLSMDIRAGALSSLEDPALLKATRQTLDMATGELSTEMIFAPGAGITLNLEVLQFASRSVPSLLCQEILVTSSADIDITFIAMIDTRFFPGTTYMSRPPGSTRADLAGGFSSPGGISRLGAAAWIVIPEGSVQRLPRSTTNAGVTRAYVTKLRGGRPLRIQTIAAMVSDVYHPEPELEAIRLASWGAMLGFDELQARNREAWSKLWQSRVRITGDSDDQRVLDAAFFYLHSSLHASTRTGMAPYGLSQSRFYSGHSFWDTESWSFLPVVLSTPETARALLEFRLRSLDMAKRQAALYGYRGAQFPWEAAQTEGFEATPTCCDTGWVEQHSTPDIALAFWEYQLATHDQEFLRIGTWPVLSAVAEWIESRGVFTSRGFEIQHIEGPDEGTPDVNNNSYMNMVSKMVLAGAIRCAQMVGVMPPSSWARIRDSLVLPTDEPKTLVLPYDRPPNLRDTHYSSGGMDYLTVHGAPIGKDLLRRTHDNEVALRDRSSNGGVGFSTAAIAATAAFLGEPDEAKRLFDSSWRDVWLEPFGMIRERPTQGYGCFLTDFGSLLQTAMLGFTGVRINEGNWAKYPASLPSGWSSIEIDRIWVRGEARQLTATNGALAKLEGL